jgi:hypothetical protein
MEQRVDTLKQSIAMLKWKSAQLEQKVATSPGSLETFAQSSVQTERSIDISAQSLPQAK